MCEVYIQCQSYQGIHMVDGMAIVERHLQTGAGFTKPPLERTSFSKGRPFFTLNFSFRKSPLTLLTKDLP